MRIIAMVNQNVHIVVFHTHGILKNEQMVQQFLRNFNFINLNQREKN